MRKLKTIPVTLFVGLLGLFTIMGSYFILSEFLRGSTKVSYIVQVSPDGHELYYCRDGRGRELVAYDLATSTKRVIGSTSALVFPYVKLQDDDRWLATVYSDKDGRARLHFLSRDLTPQDKFVESSASDSLPALSPDGRFVLFVRAPRVYGDAWGGQRWTDEDIYASSLQKLAPERLTQFKAKAISRPSITREGDSAVFSRRLTHQNDDVFSINLGSSQIEQLTPSGPTNRDPVYSSAGDRIAFASDRTKEYEYEIWLMDRSGGDLMQVTSLKRRCIDPVFLPGDKAIAFIVDEKELWRINIDGSGLKKLE